MASVLMGDIDGLIKELEGAKEQGYSHAILGGGMDGTCYAPSNKVRLFRLAMCLPEEIAKEEYRKSLGTVTGRGVTPLILLLIKPEAKDHFAWVEDETTPNDPTTHGEGKDQR